MNYHESVYQSYLLLSWGPLFYYPMAILHTAIRLVGGCISAAFQHMNDSALYKLSQITGEVQ
jgi:hypothetical protein